MNKKKILLDPALWILVAVNGYLVWHYFHNPEVFTTLIWLYWSQSLLLGFFNFIDILTTKEVSSIREGNIILTPVKRSSAYNFLLIYGILHLIYFLFLYTMKPSGPFQWEMYKYFLAAFGFGQLVSFVQHKLQQRKTPLSMNSLYTHPYLRILPVHITIVFSGFFAGAGIGIFMTLKSAADVLMYIVTSKTNQGNADMDKSLIDSQQPLNF